MIYRLKKNLEFRFIYRRGKSFANSLLVLYVFKNKMNKDNEGNLYNKVIYENYRFKDEYLNKGYDFVFVARTKLKDKNFNEVENAMDNLLKKAGLYNNEKISIKSNKIL